MASLATHLALKILPLPSGAGIGGPPYPPAFPQVSVDPNSDPHA